MHWETSVKGNAYGNTETIIFTMNKKIGAVRLLRFLFIIPFHHAMYRNTKPVNRCRCCMRGVPSRIRITRRISLGITTRPNRQSDARFLLRCPIFVRLCIASPQKSTAATHSPRCFCHRQRSPRSPVAFIYKFSLFLQFGVIICKNGESYAKGFTFEMKYDIINQRR